MAFGGFKNEMIDFAWGIRLNNNREWFLSHKEDYLNYFYRPMQELTRDVWALAEKYLPEGTHIHLSRIYRDVRRAHGDAGPYKDSLWFNIRRDYPGDWMESPVFFLEIDPDGYYFGLSTLQSKPATMRRFRERIDANPAEFERMARKLERIPGFAVDGQEYKKPKKVWGGIIDKWYNRKKISFYRSRPPDELMMSPELAAHVAGCFKRLMPLYEYAWSLYDMGEM